MNLVSINEKDELEAQKKFYDKIQRDMGEKRTKIFTGCQNSSESEFTIKELIILHFFKSKRLKDS